MKRNDLLHMLTYAMCTWIVTAYAQSACAVYSSTSVSLSELIGKPNIPTTLWSYCCPANHCCSCQHFCKPDTHKEGGAPQPLVVETLGWETSIKVIVALTLKCLISHFYAEYNMMD